MTELIFPAYLLLAHFKVFLGMNNNHNNYID